MPGYEIYNAPDHELDRSASAQVIGGLAKQSNLLLSHFEYRYHMPLPDIWCTTNDPEFSAQPAWQNGVLKEHKYGHFRYDNPIGSFHPAHDPKWTAHELCHALIGFAWQPRATRLFHSISARLSELLPVALWYFFDEADLNRCSIHQDNGPLFGKECLACHEAAKRPRRDVKNKQFYTDGRRFVDRELAAIARTRRTGIPYGTTWATLDLNNDALTWTAANANRLESDEFAWFRSLFLGPEQAAFSDLDAMEARVQEVMLALIGEGECTPLEGTHSLWAAQDLAWRLLTISIDCDTELASKLRDIIVTLSEAPNRDQMSHARTRYDELFQEWFLPNPQEVFALGYPLSPTTDSWLDQLMAGLEATIPNTTAMLGDAFEPVVLAFSDQDSAQRVPLARRFTDFLSREAPGPTAEMARYETALIHAGQPDITAEALAMEACCAETRWVRSRGVEVLSFETDISEVMAQIDELPDVLPKRAHHVLVRRASDGDLIIVEASRAASEIMNVLSDEGMTRETIPLKPAEFESLTRLGFLVPASYPLTYTA